MEEKKWNAGSIGLTFAGSFLGAGYVSGQELWQFFGSFGGGGLLGVLAAMALLAVFGLALMYIISRTGIAEMDAVRREPSGLRRGAGEQSAHAQRDLRRGDLRFL